MIIPWQEGDNIVAIDLVTEHIKTKLQQHSLRRIYPNLEVMPLTKQVGTCRTLSEAYVWRHTGCMGYNWACVKLGV